MRLALFLIACLCAPLSASYNELVGKEAPHFNANVCINPPTDGRVTMEACKGSVVLLKYWGPN